MLASISNSGLHHLWLVTTSNEAMPDYAIIVLIVEGKKEIKK